MMEEKRIGVEPVPANLEELLTDSQRAALRRIENFGWQCRTLGGGCRIDGEDLVALQIDIDCDTPDDLARGGIYRKGVYRVAEAASEVVS